MAQKKVVCIFDRKAGLFLQPVFCDSVGTVIRDLQTLMDEGRDMVAKYPGDFALMLLGEFDSVSGKFALLDVPDVVLDCSALVRVPTVMPEGHVGP